MIDPRPLGYRFIVVGIASCTPTPECTGPESEFKLAFSVFLTVMTHGIRIVIYVGWRTRRLWFEDVVFKISGFAGYDGFIRIVDDSFVF